MAENSLPKAVNYYIPGEGEEEESNCNYVAVFCYRVFYITEVNHNILNFTIK